MDQKQFAQKYPLAVKSGKNDEVDPTFTEFLARDDKAKEAAKINKDEFKKDYEALKKSGSFSSISDEDIRKGAEAFKREVQKSINENDKKLNNKLFIDKKMKKKKRTMDDVMKKVRRDEYSEISKSGNLGSKVHKNKKKYDRKSDKFNLDDELNENEGSEQNFYAIFAGLGGGFGGASFEGIIYATQEEAEQEAMYKANETYESYEGSHGIRSIDEIMDEDGVDEEDVEQIYNEEKESWLDYSAILYDPKEIENKEGYSPQEIIDGNFILDDSKDLFTERFIDNSDELNEDLKGNQHKIDANKDGKIDGKDFKILRKKSIDESSDEDGDEFECQGCRQPLLYSQKHETWQHCDTSGEDLCYDCFSDEECLEQEDELNEQRTEASYISNELSTLYDWLKIYVGDSFLSENNIHNPKFLLDKLRSGEITPEKLDAAQQKHMNNGGSKSSNVFSEMPLWLKVKKELNLDKTMNENRVILTKGQLLEMSINAKSVPGLYITDRVKRTNKTINKTELDNVFSKLEFMEKMQKDNNRIPKFNSLDEEYIETEGGGMQDLKYDVEPSKEWKDKQKKNIGDNDVAKKMMEKAKKRKELMDNRPYYKKDVQPTSNKAPEKSQKGLAFESEIPKELKVNGKHFVIEHNGVEYELMYQDNKLNVLRETPLNPINESVEKMKKLMGYNTSLKKHKLNEDALIKEHLDTVRKKFNN